MLMIRPHARAALICCFLAPLSALLQYDTKARDFFESLRPDSHYSAGGLAAKYPKRKKKRLLGLVQRMLVLDPDSSPSAAELLRDPVFKGLRNHSQSSKDNQRQIADSVSKSLKILKVRLRDWRGRGRGRGRERETETETETERERDRDRDRDRDRERERETERERERDRETERERHRERERERERQTDDRERDTQRERERDRNGER